MQHKTPPLSLFFWIALALTVACSSDPKSTPTDTRRAEDTDQSSADVADGGAQDTSTAPDTRRDDVIPDTASPEDTRVEDTDASDTTADTADTTADTADTTADTADTTTATPRILWIGAHPDDESTASPMLQEACSGPAQCRFLVLTQGENGTCGKPDGCMPSLASVRSAELLASASLFNASVVHWDLGDSIQTTPDLVLEAWGDRRGGIETLVAEVRGEIEAFDPSLILTFDPRHGITCHQDHRAAAALVLMAAEALEFAPEDIWMMASGLVLEVEGGVPTLAYLEPIIDDDPAIHPHDATQITEGRSGWETLLSVIEAHPSQFAPELADAFRAAPPERQRAYYLPLSDAVEGDPRYGEVCQ